MNSIAEAHCNNRRNAADNRTPRRVSRANATASPARLGAAPPLSGRTGAPCRAPAPLAAAPLLLVAAAEPPPARAQ